MNTQQRIERLNTFISEGRLIRNEWTGEDGQGRETACLLAAISPEVAESWAEKDCPSDLMPEWFARLTPWIDDTGSEEHWPEVIKKYANLASRWHVLSADDWERLEYKTKRIALIEARKHTNDTEVLKCVDGVIVLINRWLAGDKPAIEVWSAAESAASAEIAARSAASAARIAARNAAASAARNAASAADRMIDEILDALESLIEERE